MFNNEALQAPQDRTPIIETGAEVVGKLAVGKIWDLKGRVLFRNAQVKKSGTSECNNVVSVATPPVYSYRARHINLGILDEGGKSGINLCFRRPPLEIHPEF
jgi:hypothetical protein